MFERRARREEQSELWVMAGELPAATADALHGRVNATLDARQVWAMGEPADAGASRGGRLGIDPVAYLKMLTVGFFEDLSSERAIASRCASLSIRGYLGRRLTEATADHSSRSVIRERLSLEHLEAIRCVLLGALRGHGLLRGRELGIDSSVIEANASLRAPEHRNTEESYWAYVKRLAADTRAVRRLGRQREGCQASNGKWQNPPRRRRGIVGVGGRASHDPEAKVGRTKDGACDVVYNPEHITDLESGAILRAEKRPAAAVADDKSLCERVMEAVATLREVAPKTPLEKLGDKLCPDEGYFAIEQIAPLPACEVRTVISDPQARRRRPAQASAEHRRALQRASRAPRSQSGKALLRKWGEHLERGFCHVLDHGGLRRATLRGGEQPTKRSLTGAFSHNLSLLLWHRCGSERPNRLSPRPEMPRTLHHLALPRDCRARSHCNFAFLARYTNFFRVSLLQDISLLAQTFFKRLLVPKQTQAIN